MFKFIIKYILTSIENNVSRIYSLAANTYVFTSGHSHVGREKPEDCYIFAKFLTYKLRSCSMNIPRTLFIWSSLWFWLFVCNGRWKDSHGNTVTMSLEHHGTNSQFYKEFKRFEESKKGRKKS